MFCCYSLRTLDVDAGRRFYTQALNLDLPAGANAGSLLEAWPLHERARAPGAPAHWLGQIAVSDLDASIERLVSMGAERLGPTVQTREGIRYAALRDPFGAVVALRASAAAAGPLPVGWHQLHATQAERALEVYLELFGWSHVRTLNVSDIDGGHLLFAPRQGLDPVGSIANTGRWPGVHTHWLFYFPVVGIDAVVSRVRALGGTAREPMTLADGSRRLAACEDPQGAAFGLVERLEDG